MGILRDFEKRLEGAVEGFFARAFRSGLQPVELAKALQRYAGNYRQVGVNGVFVPNVYRFELSTSDFERFMGFGSSLERELASVVRRTARERGWQLQGPARVRLVQHDRIAMGTYELRGKVEAAPEDDRRPAAPQAPPARHSADPRPSLDATAFLPAQGGNASLRVLDGSGSGRRFMVEDDQLIGRLPECDITLDDPSVSRRHARIVRDGTGWALEDLGSTNGINVNGSKVGRARLSSGDRIEFGSVRLTFTSEG